MDPGGAGKGCAEVGMDACLLRDDISINRFARSNQWNVLILSDADLSFQAFLVQLICVGGLVFISRETNCMSYRSRLLRMCFGSKYAEGWLKLVMICISISKPLS